MNRKRRLDDYGDGGSQDYMDLQNAPLSLRSRIRECSKKGTLYYDEKCIECSTLPTLTLEKIALYLGGDILKMNWQASMIRINVKEVLCDFISRKIIQMMDRMVDLKTLETQDNKRLMKIPHLPNEMWQEIMRLTKGDNRLNFSLSTKDATTLFNRLKKVGMFKLEPAHENLISMYYNHLTQVEFTDRAQFERFPYKEQLKEINLSFYFNNLQNPKEIFQQCISLKKLTFKFHNIRDQNVIDFLQNLPLSLISLSLKCVVHWNVEDFHTISINCNNHLQSLNISCQDNSGETNFTFEETFPEFIVVNGMKSLEELKLFICPRFHFAESKMDEATQKWRNPFPPKLKVFGFNFISSASDNFFVPNECPAPHIEVHLTRHFVEDDESVRPLYEGEEENFIFLSQIKSQVVKEIDILWYDFGVTHFPYDTIHRFKNLESLKCVSKTETDFIDEFYDIYVPNLPDTLKHLHIEDTNYENSSIMFHSSQRQLPLLRTCSVITKRKIDLPDQPLHLLSNCWKIQLFAHNISFSDERQLSKHDSESFFGKLNKSLYVLQISNCSFLAKNCSLNFATFPIRSLRKFGLGLSGKRHITFPETLPPLQFVKHFVLYDIYSCKGVIDISSKDLIDFVFSFSKDSPYKEESFAEMTIKLDTKPLRLYVDPLLNPVIVSGIPQQKGVPLILESKNIKDRFY